MNWAWFLGILVGSLIAHASIDLVEYLIIKKHKEKKGE